jgi:hypothetical protein
MRVLHVFLRRATKDTNFIEVDNNEIVKKFA